VRAARNALRRAGLEPSDLDAVFAHATATPDNDGAESAALRALFGPDLRRLAVTALKSRFGHCLGGAGAVELAVAIDALRRGSIPATHGVEAADLEFADVPLTIAGPGAIRPRASLSMSLGFGGANAAVILGPPDRPPPARPPIRRDPLRAVHITGMGTIVPGAIGLEALARLRAQGRKIDGSPPPPLDESLLEPHLAAARRTRRMALYSRLTLAATSMALAQAGLTSPDDRAETAAILGATHGALGYCCDYYRRIVREGMAGANPMLFAEGVPNVAAAHLTMTFGLKSGGWTILGSRTAALEAVALAFDRIAGGLAERIIVGAAEERVDELDAVYRAMDPWSLPAGYGAASIVLESEGSMARRGAASLGIVESAMTAAADRLPAAGAPVGGDRPHELFCVQPLIDLATALIGAVRASSPITVRADDPHGLSAAVHVRLSDR
jgi:3-oxoacyl-[acyl-carrier-protein] synthase II